MAAWVDRPVSATHYAISGALRPCTMAAELAVVPDVESVVEAEGRQ